MFSSIALWSVSKRRPMFNLPRAHKATSIDPSMVPASLPEEFWITALASLRYTDLLASGSFNGHINLWKSTAEFNHLSLLFTLPQVRLIRFLVVLHPCLSAPLIQIGFVNDLKFSSDGNHLVVAIGQEHRLGRWWTVKAAKNALLIYKLNRAS
jgi:ribosomal RNA-processing protein 9